MANAKGQRAQVHSGELANDLGMFETEEVDRVLDMMQMNADQASYMVGDIEQVSRPAHEFKSDIEYEAFMHEGVVIRIAESSDQNAPWAAFVGVNGDSRWLPRGVPVRIPRKFVERLAQSFERNIRTNTNPGSDSDDCVKTTARQSQPYAFSVLSDPSGSIGHKWLARMTRQGT